MIAGFSRWSGTARFSRRVAAVAVACALAVAALPATAAYAGTYSCADGSRFFLSGLLGYIIIGNGCTGEGSGPASVTIESGPYAGEYDCRYVTLTPEIGLLSGQDC